MPDKNTIPAENELNEVSILAVKAKDDPALMADLWDGVKYFIRNCSYKYVVRSYAWQGQSTRFFDADDLIQAGYLALVDAVRRYDSAKCAFITLLHFCIRNRFNKVAGRRTAKKRPEFDASSLDIPIGEDGDSTIADLLADPDAEFEEKVIDREDLKQDYADLLEEIDKLPERQRLVLTLYLCDGLTLDAIAEALGGGLSRQAVGAIKNNAMEKIRTSPTGLRISADRYKRVQIGGFMHKINCEADKYYLYQRLNTRGRLSRAEKRILQEAGWDKE